MENIILQGLIFLAAVIGFLLGKYITPKVPKQMTRDLEGLEKWADKFVVYAREFMKSSAGREKMKNVVRQLRIIAEAAEINVTEEQLRAITQTAYEAMRAGEEVAERQREKR